MAVVLKLRMGDEMRRVCLRDAASVEEMSYFTAMKAISEVWPECLSFTAKYADEEGDLCTLTEATFPDFRVLAAAAAAASGKKPAVVRLELQAAEMKPLETTEEANKTENVEVADEPAKSPMPETSPKPEASTPPSASPDEEQDGLPGFAQQLRSMFKGFFKGKGKGKGKGKCRGMSGDFSMHHQAKQGFLVLSQLHSEGLLTEQAMVAATIAALPRVVEFATQHPQEADRKLKWAASKHPELMQEIVAVLAETAAMEGALDGLLALLASGEGEVDAEKQGSVALQLLSAVHAMSFDAQVSFLMQLAGAVGEPLKKKLEEKERHCGWWLSWHRQAHSMEHSWVTCDSCGAAPIKGLRFKSTEHPDYDLCSDCFLKKSSGPCANHEFKCIPWATGGCKSAGKGMRHCHWGAAAPCSNNTSPDFDAAEAWKMFG
eukprot:CAMPEP_0178408994 /NCGR_PEP_ID=MMETSP0689_2-20121128/20231_1 /TAXON_ID=160604 /ORGANISM="Amphidinium massartii, Strain CS-259" /LENGTH=431 /DNA_ID=CAMNT_0020030117 /DNA_START=106 /DNA_END=1401 /DNA_ORIENTATION=+